MDENFEKDVKALVSMTIMERVELINRDFHNRTFHEVLLAYGKRYGDEVAINKLFIEDEAYDIDGYFIVKRIGHITNIEVIGENCVVPHVITNNEIEVYDPSGKSLIKTNNELTFLDILFQIRKKKLDGFSAKCENHIFGITNRGHILDAPNSILSKYCEYLDALYPLDEAE